MHHKVGHYAFIIGVVLSLIAGLFQFINAWVILLLVVLGIVVGFLNISAKEFTGFLVAGIALMVAGSANVLILDNIFSPLGSTIAAMLGFIKIFVAPAVIVVGLKAVKIMAEK